MRATLAIAFIVLFAIFSLQAASAASCSSWRSLCVKRARANNPAYLPDCDAKFGECLSGGCFTEGAKFGGATHCGLAKK